MQWTDSQLGLTSLQQAQRGQAGSVGIPCAPLPHAGMASRRCLLGKPPSDELAHHSPVTYGMAHGTSEPG